LQHDLWPSPLEHGPDRIPIDGGMLDQEQRAISVHQPGHRHRLPTAVMAGGSVPDIAQTIAQPTGSADQVAGQWDHNKADVRAG
jgi:hypothetical protein